MSIIGNKISLIGIIFSVLSAAARVGVRFLTVATGGYTEFMTHLHSLVNLAAVGSLALLFVGYVLKFIGDKDIFDIITAFCIFVSVIIIFDLIVPGGGYIFYYINSMGFFGEIIYSMLSELALFGLGINFIKKGSSVFGIVAVLIYLYIAILWPVGVWLIFGGGAGGMIGAILALFNSVIFLGAQLASFLAIKNEN